MVREVGATILAEGLASEYEPLKRWSVQIIERDELQATAVGVRHALREDDEWRDIHPTILADDRT